MIGTTVIAVLAVVVAVLSYRVADRQNTASPGDLSAVEARLDELGGQLKAIDTTARAARQQAKTAVATAQRASKAKPADSGLSTCLTQMQREIDDLQAYLAYRTPPRRDRVSGACATLLKPRFNR